ncbi:hypothetical protein E2C01_023178 [Portunus trituberculatus]|uniref:Uncharacterized protein n=1 Tax=Portunus trituberculatus TaxID=210409 RepID=A0A5B7E9B4_PORTR|nr:hypothetical protein [Portunus trituberculatus]
MSDSYMKPPTVMYIQDVMITGCNSEPAHHELMLESQLLLKYDDAGQQEAKVMPPATTVPAAAMPRSHTPLPRIS